MIQNVRDYLLTWVDFVIATPTATRAESVDHLQLVANITNVEGNDWFDALAVLLDSIGSINNPAYASMRNDVINSGDVISKNLFDAVFGKIRELPETSTISFAIKNFERQRRLAEINVDLTQVRAYRDALPAPPAITDPGEERAVRKALTDGVQALREEKQAIQARLG